MRPRSASSDDADDACAVEQHGAAAIRAVRHGRVADRAEAIVSKRVVTAYKKRRPPIGRDGELLCHAFYDLEVKVCGGASASIKAHAPERAVPARRPARPPKGRERAREPEGTSNNSCRRRLRRPLHRLVRKERDL